MPVIEGYAIVSRDGMIANADGSYPAELKIDADQRFFQAGLRRSQAIAHGRNSGGEGSELSTGRRLIVTRRVDTVSIDPTNAKAVLWNPAGASVAEACRLLSLDEHDTLAVVGGTDVFGLFLEIGYDAFFLSRAADIEIPRGRPVFPGGGPPQAALSRRGMALRESRSLDAERALVLETWRRAADGGR